MGRLVLRRPASLLHPFGAWLSNADGVSTCFGLGDPKSNTEFSPVFPSRILPEKLLKLNLKTTEPAED